ncbi:unnamed protein product [Ambrosiozyma monospora]|uniref:Unnamed protein product n=1 Tax=Ambrosiozyma monospora TaxID=43982 RepID=A0A9W7DJN0_AMBMO|nr:unnamed protein product [Ambrosiozyma monospora]
MTTTLQGLTDLEIVSVEIPQKQFFDKVKGDFILQSKGYGFITFTSEADATKAIETINGKFIGEREIYAKTAVPQNPFRRHNNNYNNNSVNGGSRGGFRSFNNGVFVPYNNNNSRPVGMYGNGQPQQHQQHFGYRNNGYMGGNQYRNDFPKAPAAFYQPRHMNYPFHGGYNNNGGPQSQSRSVPAPFRPQRTKEEKQKRLDDGTPSKTTIFVGNLDRNVNLQDLKDLLAELEPQWVRVPRKILPQHLYQKLRAQGIPIQNKGIAFVRFANEENQRKAIELFNGKEFKGKPLNVTVAIDSLSNQDQDQDQDQGQGQGASVDGFNTGGESVTPASASETTTATATTAAAASEEQPKSTPVEKSTTTKSASEPTSASTEVSASPVAPASAPAATTTTTTAAADKE